MVLFLSAGLLLVGMIVMAVQLHAYANNWEQESMLQDFRAEAKDAGVILNVTLQSYYASAFFTGFLAFHAAEYAVFTFSMRCSICCRGVRRSEAGRAVDVRPQRWVHRAGLVRFAIRFHRTDVPRHCGRGPYRKSTSC